MTDEIGYYEHTHHKYLYNGLQEYIAELPGQKVLPDLVRYRDYLLQHFVQNPMPLFELEKCQDGNGYPTEAFLISLAETDVPLQNLHTYHRLMETVCSAWNCEYGSIECKGNAYVMYTGGWSGNEDILSAMFSNVSIYVFVKQDVNSRYPAVVKISYRVKKARK